MTDALSYILGALVLGAAILLATSGPALKQAHDRTLYWLGLATTATSLALVATTLIGRPI